MRFVTVNDPDGWKTVWQYTVKEANDVLPGKMRHDCLFEKEVAHQTLYIVEKQ